MSSSVPSAVNISFSHRLCPTGKVLWAPESPVARSLVTERSGVESDTCQLCESKVTQPAELRSRPWGPAVITSVPLKGSKASKGLGRVHTNQTSTGPPTFPCCRTGLACPDVGGGPWMVEGQAQSGEPPLQKARRRALFERVQTPLGEIRGSGKTGTMAVPFLFPIPALGALTPGLSEQFERCLKSEREACRKRHREQGHTISLAGLKRKQDQADDLRLMELAAPPCPSTPPPEGRAPSQGGDAPSPCPGLSHH